jgi:hypothetical protein
MASGMSRPSAMKGADMRPHRRPAETREDEVQPLGQFS